MSQNIHIRLEADLRDEIARKHPEWSIHRSMYFEEGMYVIIKSGSQHKVIGIIPTRTSRRKKLPCRTRRASRNVGESER